MKQREKKQLRMLQNVYLGELVDRCMVQVGKRSSSGRIKTCRLHDLVQNLCLSKANQENFLRIVDLQDGNKLMNSPSGVTIAKSTPRVRRVAVYGEETLEFFLVQEITRYIRSLLFFRTTRDNDGNFQKMISWSSGFRLLKILDLERHLTKGNLSREIGKLINLRYLSVNCSTMKKIPSFIGNLRCLQTLILNGDVAIRIPNVIWKMVQLRHLYISKNVYIIRGNLRLGDLRNLQMLQQIDIRNFNIEELTKLTNLRKLDIYIRDYFQELKKILNSRCVKFDRLRSLKIRWFERSTVEEADSQTLFSACHNLYNLFLTGPIAKLPEYPQFPTNLTKLTLVESELEEDPMPTLEKLPYLTILRLRLFAFVGKEMVCSSKGFPQLKSLHLLSLPSLEEWRVGVDKEAAMPNLSHLVIYHCRHLKKIPNGLRFITTLRKLEIVIMPTHFTDRLQQGGEDYDKVRHVPSITFQDILYEQ